LARGFTGRGYQLELAAEKGWPVGIVSSMPFDVDDVLVVRYWRGPMLRVARPCRVIEDTGRGVTVWLARGTWMKGQAPVHGQPSRRLADQLATTEWHMTDRRWQGDGVVQWFPPDRSAHSVLWFFDAGRFDRWYINLEAPAAAWSRGLDTCDHALDVLVAPDRTWRLKDEDEFAERTGHPWYWTPEQADAIRAEAERVAKLAENGRFPFDGTWCDFTPPPDWPLPSVPPGWDRPRQLL
jgi:protein associated with RNAse G/E